MIVTDTSPTLFRDLPLKGFGACGMARRDRRGIPSIIRDTALKKGELVSRRRRHPLPGMEGQET